MNLLPIGLDRITRGLRRRLFSGTVVLLYHRVAAPSCDPQLLAVTPERFEQHLQIIRKVAPAISLAELARSLRNGFSPRRAVVITFDDGYADNFTHAAPLLEKHTTPATMFITSGALGEPGFFWDQAAAALAPSDAWNVLDEPLEDAHRRYLDLCNTLRPMTAEERSRHLGRVRCIDPSTPDAVEPAKVRTADPTSRVMTAEELAKLAANPLIEIGAHTVTHAHLASLLAAEQFREVFDSKKRLETITGKPVESFSYPFGGRRDY